MEKMTERTKLVVKDMEKIENSNILLLGVGGVGGYVLEMLVRLGVKHISVVDCDVFDETNLNRQLLATIGTLGLKKAEVARARAMSINPNIELIPFCEKITKENISTFLSQKFDYVIDAIDDVSAKVAVIKFCKENDIPFVSAMGTGNRFHMPQFVASDLFKTSYDGLSRKMRTELKKEGITSGVPVVYTKEQAEKTSSLGSVVYYPLMCAGTIVSFVTNNLLNK